MMDFNFFVFTDYSETRNPWTSVVDDLLWSFDNLEDELVDIPEEPEAPMYLVHYDDQYAVVSEDCLSEWILD